MYVNSIQYTCKLARVSTYVHALQGDGQPACTHLLSSLTWGGGLLGGGGEGERGVTEVYCVLSDSLYHWF